MHIRLFVLLVVWISVGLSGTARAQTMPLNDTGQTQCYDAANAGAPCDAATTGNTGVLPHQDGRYGRDAKAGAGHALPKVGGGAAGFDFSCVLWNGTVINGPNCHAGLVANTTGSPSATPATDWACTKDNVTGLVWSLQLTGPVDWSTAISPSYPDPGHNSANRCGFGTAWRVPSRRELLSLSHFGASGPPAIEAVYFPSTEPSAHWTGSRLASSATEAWVLDFLSGNPYPESTTSSRKVRLVWSGP